MNLDNKEKLILSGLYKIGQGSVSMLAKQTLINRTTLYPILEKLILKGLVSKIKTESTTIFEPIPLKDFKAWVKRKEEQVKTEADNLLDWVKDQESEEVGSLLSEIKYFDGKEGLKTLYRDTWAENKSKQIYGATDFVKGYEAMGAKYWEEYFSTRTKHGVQIKSLVPDTVMAKTGDKDSKKYLREMKFVNIFKDLGIEINVYDDKVLFSSFDKDHPNGILIKNKKISEALREIIQYIWKNTK